MRKTAHIFFILLLAVACATAVYGASAGAAPNPLKAISGLWYTEGHEGGIQLYTCDDKICGRFYVMRDEKDANGEDGITRDTHNPDPGQRMRPLCHLQFMGNFMPDEGNHYTGGWVYNPRDGGIYSAEMTLIDHNTLKLRGYLFLPLLGQSQIWTRAKSMPDCATGD